MIDPKQIERTECREAPFPLELLGLSERPEGFTVVVHRSTLNTMKMLGRASMRAEVGGMLVGSLLWDDGPYLLIDASIEGKYTDDQVASVTFTADTWDYVHEEMERLHVTKKIVGWYHTHPGFGVFLSHMDLFIHENFFSSPWQVAYVYDPQSGDEGFFVWNGSKLQRVKPLVVEDAELLNENLPPECQVPRESMKAAAMPNDKIVIEAPDRGWTLLLLIITSCILLACLLGIGFLVRENMKQRGEIVSMKNSLENYSAQLGLVQGQINNIHARLGWQPPPWPVSNSSTQSRPFKNPEPNNAPKTKRGLP